MTDPNIERFPVEIIDDKGNVVPIPSLPRDFMKPDPNIAPEGKIWVCMDCFRKAKERFELTDWDNWACYNNAILCDEVQPAPGFYAISAPRGQAPGNAE